MSDGLKRGDISKNRLGSYYHWLILICCCLMAGVTIGFFNNAYGVFYTPLSGHFHAGRGQVALHATISLLVTALTAPAAVKLTGRMKITHMMLLSMLFEIASLLLILPARHLWQLNVIGVIRGIGGGFIHVPIITSVILPNWFHGHIGISMGVVFSAASGFGALFSLITTWIIHHVDYKAAIILCAVLVIIMMLPCVLLIRLRPEELGLIPMGEKKRDGESGGAAETDESKEAGRAAEALGAEDREAASTGRGKSFLKMPEFYLLCLFASITVPVMALSMHFSGFCENIGAGAVFGGVMMSVSLAGSVVFKLLVGELLDLIGGFRMMAVVLAADLISMIMIFGGRNNPGSGMMLLIGAFIFGIHASIGSIGIAGLTRAAMGKADDGTAFSVISACASGANALSITIIGLMYDFTGSYDLPFTVGICMLTAGAVLLGVIWRRAKVGV